MWYFFYSLLLLFGLALMYLIAAPLTSLISLDMRETEWANVMTYFIWLFSPFIWMFCIVGATIILALPLIIFDRR